MKIGVAVSGTGGHIYPALSIAEFAKEKNDEIIFLCNNNVTTRKILANYDFDIVTLKISGWKNREIKSFVKALFLLFFSFLKSIFFIKKYNLDLLICFGGYLSFPVGLAAKFSRKKLIIHEQNIYPGLVNKLLNRVADITALGFGESAGYFKKNNTVFTGNPIRKEFYDVIPTAKKVVLIFGGSQGAHGINSIMGKSLLYLKGEDVEFIHITGSLDKNFVAAYYEDSYFSNKSIIYEYHDKIYELFNRTALVISRAGASTISEILTVGVPAILIPYPYATEDHQLKNAKFLQGLGVAEIFREEDIDIQVFVRTLKRMLGDQKLIAHAKAVSLKFKENNFSENLYNLCLQN
ncbi:MAG: UDP-N-acetylglucosamine--N-acetylmuramyl-(pentapeptide) pyrophosphoryl-undecaprenol N-acetylglucosamine transferase [bacterium]|nr:UDP-N-acetylglucosamine--N-acetylmuramyl-(pentapeptide) pyrophosphoryl-undecaprenol N-acetylglucosamine transferase [bacterium]